jgi:hypothetical protein
LSWHNGNVIIDISSDGTPIEDAATTPAIYLFI